MQEVKVDFSKGIGKIKPMNAVNNGPACAFEDSAGNFDAYKALKIPYARLHDSSFYKGYGGECTVDVHRIFPDFDADENNPKSYIFAPTDKYLQEIDLAGTKIYYRLGASIEHHEKKGTYPPKDFAKWARICEKIILHYTQGWANGFYYDIEYWEIWNEPDGVNFDEQGNFSHSATWQGTYELFHEFYVAVSKYLKEKFPQLKIGGCSFTGAWENLTDKFLKAFKKADAPLDFYSFHAYKKDPKRLEHTIRVADEQRKDSGYPNAELHLNEWNYVDGWKGEALERSRQAQYSIKGAAFVAACMSVAQNTPLDMLMYYDARPCLWNGIFERTTLQPLKTYFSFKAWSKLVGLGESVAVECDGDLYATGATDGKESAILLTYYNDEDREDKEICISLDGLNGGLTAEIYLLDETHDLSLTQTLAVENKITLTMKNQTVCWIKITKS